MKDISTDNLFKGDAKYEDKEENEITLVNKSSGEPPEAKQVESLKFMTPDEEQVSNVN